MKPYLKRFYGTLKKYEGSLIKVSWACRLNKNAKEYLAKLAKEGVIERVSWGWYYLPTKRTMNSLEFLQRDHNFKAIVNQSAASFWNGDFIHREILSVAVDNLSFKRALEEFAKKRNWEMKIEYRKNLRNFELLQIKNLAVERPIDTAIDCVKNWAFVDAAAVLVANKNKIDVEKLIRKSYWIRISGTNVRVRQAIEYMTHELGEKTKNIDIKNVFVKQELDEAAEKVSEFEQH